MSKKNQEPNSEEVITAPLSPKKRKRKKWPLIILFLIIIGGVIFFFRTPILNGLGKVPIIGQWIPVQEEAEEELSVDELKVKVASQDKEIERLNSQIETLELSQEALEEKNEDLARYEVMYTDFMEQKAQWDEEIAQTNPDLFIEQFETVYPDVAERIYQTLKKEQVLSDEQKKLSTTIGQMDEDQAAAALELLVATDPELIQVIFEGMGTDSKALVLSAMTEQGAAQVIKLISPDH